MRVSVVEKAINDATYWREFDKNELSHSMAHYLMAIDALRADLGYARSTDVAEMLSVSRGAASMALNQLKKRGWVAEDPHRFLLLTEEGEKIASSIEHNYAILSKFFERVLHVEDEVAAADACKIEHLMSMETGQRLLWLMRYLLSDEDLAVRVRQRMKGFREKCDSLKGSICPICGGETECLAAEPGEGSEL